MADLEDHKMEKTYNEHITPLDFLIKVGVHVDSSFTEKGEFIRKEEECYRQGLGLLSWAFLQ